MQQQSISCRVYHRRLIWSLIGVCCVGHGKSIVNAINRTDKNVILWVTHRQVKHTDESDLNKSLNVDQFNFTKMKKVSVAENCKQLLKHDYQQERLRKIVKKKEEVSQIDIGT